MALAPRPKSRFRLNIRNRREAEAAGPLVEGCPCLACTRLSRGYVHYLSRARELTGVRLVTLHNLVYVERIVSGARSAIATGCFGSYRDATLAGAAPWEALAAASG